MTTTHKFPLQASDPTSDLSSEPRTSPESSMSGGGPGGVDDDLCRLSTRTLSNDSGVMKEITSAENSDADSSEYNRRSQSCDRLAGNNKKPAAGELSKPRRGLANLSLLSSGGSRLAGIVGSGSRILRRHTTYIKNTSSAEEPGKQAGHVHSWHKQVGMVG